MNEFLDCGQIVNTHGVHGEVRIVPWADSPELSLIHISEPTRR